MKNLIAFKRKVATTQIALARSRAADAQARRSYEGMPIGWIIIWLLLALTIFPKLTQAQTSLQQDAREPEAIAARVPFQSVVATLRPDVTTPLAVERVDAVGMTVADMDRSVEFYSKVLSFEKVSDVEVAGEEYEHLEGIFGLRMRVVRMRLGGEFIELTEYFAPKGRPVPVDSRSNDRWFQHVAIITSNMEKAYSWLRQNKVEHASSGPQRLPDWNKNAGGIKAFYFKDPDGHVLEILQFPAGKGDPKWQQAATNAGNKLFLGIDHTAIVVGDTEASLKFYRDVLGMRIAGESENYGTEQEHLNNVFGAHLRITSMRASVGPGIEFLEYLAPRTGRMIPVDEHANDLFHWQTRLIIGSASQAAQNLLGRFNFVSSSVVDLSRKELGFEKGFLVRDPDGHVMQLVER